MGRPGTALLSSGALRLALFLSSCAPPEAGADTDTAGGTQDLVSEPGSSPSATPEPANPPSATPPSDDGDGAEWATYTTPDGTLSFDHPGDWTVTASAPAPAQGEAVTVEDGIGRQLASLRTELVTGAECPAKVPYALLDSEPLPALAQPSGIPMFVFEGRTDPSVPDPVTASTLAYGITSAPLPDGPTACPIAHFFTWPPSGAAFGGIYDPYEIYPGKPMHIDTPQAYMETEEYQRIRTMLTSLRPAGRPPGQR
ncbi:hypothetical protein [Arthrobacter sp. Ld5]|uniref:hypothetical protein n=1 Tax=Arthrobacter sp. Ld5 TaxID=649152 RepID=UPI003EB77709